MKKVLITGATGNVGMAVLQSLHTLKHHLDIYAGLRNLESEQQKLADFKIKSVRFDFTDIQSYLPALEQCDILFLLRPPQISEVAKFFAPLIQTAVQCGVQHIVFLSVQGVERSSIIPHHKIEQLIVASNIRYTFLRPAYFMQNFTSTLQRDLVDHQMIFLPAGNTPFTLVDVSDIGMVAANILTATEDHLNKSYELTNNERLTFTEMASKLSQGLHTTITYQSPSLLKFYCYKRKEKMPVMLILVMIMLHYLPRFQQVPKITNWVERINKKQPHTFEQFILENRKNLMK